MVYVDCVLIVEAVLVVPVKDEVGLMGRFTEGRLNADGFIARDDEGFSAEGMRTNRIEDHHF